MASSTLNPGLLEQLLQGRDLSSDEAAALMQLWLDGAIEPVLTGALLAGLRAKGVSGAELAAMAEVLRNACVLPAERPSLPLVDTCGTGGTRVESGLDSFNVSTAVAFTAAACGVNIAKHGNRSASGRVGSADVLEALGINLAAPPCAALAALPRTGVTFLFAPGWHPSLAGLAPLRKALGVRTVFNLLGPLVNPLRPEAHVLGVARADLLDPMADALRRLGMARAVVVHGHGGLDEATLSGPSELRVLDNGQIRAEQLDPVALGLSPAPPEAIRGGDLATNTAILEAVLQGRGAPAHSDVVALNAALVLWVAGRCDTFAGGLAEAHTALGSGAAWQRLQALRSELGNSAAG